MKQDAATYELVIQRILEATRARVWAAWTTDEMCEWGCPKGPPCSGCDDDVRVGEKYNCTVVGPDGKKHPADGVYREVRKNERLVFTYVWDNDSHPEGKEPLVKVEFKAFGGGRTKMNFSQTNLPTPESLRDHRQVWDESFDRLEALLSSKKDKED